MIHNMAVKLSNYLLTNGIVRSDNLQFYVYGFEKALGKWLMIGVLLLISIFLKAVIPSIVFIVFFLTLREAAGGVHASSSTWCMILSILMYLVSIKLLLPLLINNINVSTILVLASILSIWNLAPLNHPNLGFDKDEIIICKRKARVVLIVEMITILLGIYINIDNIYISSAALGIIVSATLLIIGKLLKQEVIENEE